MLPLGQVLQNSHVDYHSYADDRQIYIALSSDDYSPIQSSCHCLEQVTNWMNQNFLQLNQDKTEVIVFGNKEKRIAVSKHLQSLSLKTRDQVRNIGMLIDSDFTFSSHIKSITKTAFYQLKNISRVKVYGVKVLCLKQTRRSWFILSSPVDSTTVTVFWLDSHKEALNSCSSFRMLQLESLN